MKTVVTALALTAAFALPAVAGDAAAGAKVFNKCQTCHSVVDDTGAVLAGKGAKTGPNLYKIVGRVAGSMEGFKYGSGLEALKAQGFAWTEADIAAYVQDPAGYVHEKAGDKKLQAKMMFKLKNETEAADVAAYLASLAPAG